MILSTPLYSIYLKKLVIIIGPVDARDKIISYYFI